MSPPDIEPATVDFLTGHPVRLAIDIVDNLSIPGNAWGVSKHVAIKHIKLLSLNVNSNK